MICCVCKSKPKENNWIVGKLGETNPKRGICEACLDIEQKANKHIQDWKDNKDPDKKITPSVRLSQMCVDIINRQRESL